MNIRKKQPHPLIQPQPLKDPHPGRWLKKAAPWGIFRGNTVSLNLVFLCYLFCIIYLLRFPKPQSLIGFNQTISKNTLKIVIKNWEAWQINYWFVFSVVEKPITLKIDLLMRNESNYRTKMESMAPYVVSVKSKFSKDIYLTSSVIHFAYSYFAPSNLFIFIYSYMPNHRSVGILFVICPPITFTYNLRPPQSSNSPMSQSCHYLSPYFPISK
jgi:hypothetical protein